jgi:hypothetical protein
MEAKETIEGMEPRITATELAEYVFCRHAWTLRRKGAAVSVTIPISLPLRQLFGVQVAEGRAIFLSPITPHTKHDPDKGTKIQEFSSVRPV